MISLSVSRCLFEFRVLRFPDWEGLFTSFRIVNKLLAEISYNMIAIYVSASLHWPDNTSGNVDYPLPGVRGIGAQYFSTFFYHVYSFIL